VTATGGPIGVAVLMCGGRGTRLGGDREKPLVEVGGRPMVGRVLDALAGSRIERVHAAVSPHAPATRSYLAGRSPDGVALDVVETPGEGYVADLEAALAAAGRPALTAVADLPLLAAAHVDGALAAATAGVGGGDGGDSGPGSGDGDGRARSVTVCVPAALKRRLGVSVDAATDRDGRELAPTGLNVVGGGGDRVVVRDDRRLAVNVNRPGDLAVARRLATA